MELNQKLVYNYLIECGKKKEIDSYERATILKEYLRVNNISIHGLAKDLGMPYTTLNDWLIPLKLSKEEFNKSVEQKGKANTIKSLRNKEYKSTNLDKLIGYFREFKADSQEKLKIRDLIAVLLDCLKR